MSVWFITVFVLLIFVIQCPAKPTLAQTDKMTATIFFIGRYVAKAIIALHSSIVLRLHIPFASTKLPFLAGGQSIGHTQHKCFQLQPVYLINTFSETPTLRNLKKKKLPASFQVGIDFEVGVSNPWEEENTFIDQISVDLPAAYEISLAMEGSDMVDSDADGDGKSSVDDVVTFTLTVTNTGTVDLTSVEVQTAAGLEGLVCQQFTPSATAVGERCVIDRCNAHD